MDKFRTIYWAILFSINLLLYSSLARWKIRFKRDRIRKPERKVCFLFLELMNLLNLRHSSLNWNKLLIQFRSGNNYNAQPTNLTSKG